MRPFSLTFLCFTLATSCLFAQDPQFGWAMDIGGSSNDEGKYCVADDLGNIYVSGTFKETVDCDPGPSIYNLVSNGKSDIYIAKYNSLGDIIWAYSFGDTASDVAPMIKLDDLGHLYVVGSFLGTVDFNPGGGSCMLSTNGYIHAFILKMDTTGGFIWAKHFGSNNSTHGVGCLAVGLDTAECVYSYGIFAGTADFDPGTGIYNLTANGTKNLFISKLDNNGNFCWAKSFGTFNKGYCGSLAIDATGNCYATGGFTSTVDFDPGVGINYLTSNGQKDIFLLKLYNSGNFAWAKSMGSNPYESGLDVAIHPSGSIFVTGHFGDTVDFNPGGTPYYLNSNGNEDIFIANYDTSGTLIWAKSMGGTISDVGTSINFDDNGNTYITGFFQNNMDLDPGAGTSWVISQGWFDMFYFKIFLNR